MAATVERYESFDIEWISVPSVGPCGHGIELHYDDGSRKLRVGFIDGYRWYHDRKGQCRVFTLSPDSNEWTGLTSITDVLSDLRESVRIVLRDIKLNGSLKGNIFARANG